MAVPPVGASRVECRLDSAHDLAALLAALQLREKDQKDQRVHCEATAAGLKLAAQSTGKDVAVLGWLFAEAFKEYRFVTGDGAAADSQSVPAMHLKLPVMPLISCLQIFSDRAQLIMKYPSGPFDQLRFTLEEDGAVTECCVKTLALDEAPMPVPPFLAPGERPSCFRPKQAEAWHLALSEFGELEAPDVELRVTLRQATDPDEPAVILRARTTVSDAEVELPRSSLDQLDIFDGAGAVGEVTHSYLLTSVLQSCIRAAKDAKAVKVRFNQMGTMSNQFILKGRGPRDIFCEALVSPIATQAASTAAPGGMQGATSLSYLGTSATLQGAVAGMDSVGF